MEEGWVDQTSESTQNTNAEYKNNAEHKNNAEVDESIEPAIPSRDRELQTAGQLIERGELAKAADKLRGLLITNPTDVEVLFTLATLEAARGDLVAGIELLDGIPPDHPEAGLPAIGQAADWCMEMGRYNDAETRYREVLNQAPNALIARRQLAFLLNRQGRRHEAAEQVRELCRSGNVRQDELHSLVMLSHAMWDDPNAENRNASAAVYRPIGSGGTARKLFTDGKFAEAADQLEDQLAGGAMPPAILALYGRCVVEAQDDQRFLRWLSMVNSQTRQMADYWAALGTYLISQRRFDEATRALLEAVDRDPTDMFSMGRLGQTLLTLGDAEASERWLDRWDDLNELVKANNRISETNPPSPEKVDELIELLEKLDRPLEGLMWKAIADQLRGISDQEQASNNARMKQLLADNSGFATQAVRLCGLDPRDYPAPDLTDLQSGSVAIVGPGRARADAPTVPRFENHAAPMGITHAFQVAAQPQTEGFAIYQTYGGAVAVLDYDLDGQCDLYFSQGGSDPPSFSGPSSNQMFRGLSHSPTVDNPSGVKMIEVTSESDAIDRRYSLGVTAGDWNQDGFADLVVANLGDDSLLINNGDGTFKHYPIIAPNDQFRVPTSVAIADLTGDQLPDIFELSYVDDPAMIYLPKRNEQRQVIKAMSPMQYAAGADRICVNDGSGGMSIGSFNTDASDYRTGLGLIVTDFNQSPGNEVFVGNDLYPDQLWVRDLQTDRWSDIAQAVGCAFGIRGSKTASMGIAVGDLDNSGTNDIHITNYQNRNSSLFMNLGESFLERNVQYGLDKASQAVLGFGTQTIDYDNDGLLDILVTNGHIEKAVTIDEPFEQPAQLFCNLGGRFDLVNVQDSSGYWKAKHLGRGMARVDLNRDGKNDVVITHLGETSAVLINRTSSDNHWLQVQLVGVECERDAIGAKVTVDVEGSRFTSWVTAGDGYLARNEPVLAFGLGDVTSPVRIEIVWPDGSLETLQGVTIDQRILVVQGQGTPFSMWNDDAGS